MDNLDFSVRRVKQSKPDTIIDLDPFNYDGKLTEDVYSQLDYGCCRCPITINPCAVWDNCKGEEDDVKHEEISAGEAAVTYDDSEQVPFLQVINTKKYPNEPQEYCTSGNAKTCGLVFLYYLSVLPLLIYKGLVQCKCFNTSYVDKYNKMKKHIVAILESFNSLVLNESPHIKKEYEYDMLVKILCECAKKSSDNYIAQKLSDTCLFELHERKDLKSLKKVFSPENYTSFIYRIMSAIYNRKYVDTRLQLWYGNIPKRIQQVSAMSLDHTNANNIREFVKIVKNKAEVKSDKFTDDEINHYKENKDELLELEKHAEIIHEFYGSLHLSVEDNDVMQGPSVYTRIIIENNLLNISYFDILQTIKQYITCNEERAVNSLLEKSKLVDKIRKNRKVCSGLCKIFTSIMKLSIVTTSVVALVYSISKTA